MYTEIFVLIHCVFNLEQHVPRIVKLNVGQRCRCPFSALTCLYSPDRGAPWVPLEIKGNQGMNDKKKRKKDTHEKK